MCFCHPPNSDMDYRIFNVRTWSFLCVPIHTGVGRTHSVLAQHFWLRKTHNFCVCSWRGPNLRSSHLESDALPIEPLQLNWTDENSAVQCLLFWKSSTWSLNSWVKEKSKQDNFAVGLFDFVGFELSSPDFWTAFLTFQWCCIYCHF